LQGAIVTHTSVATAHPAENDFRVGSVISRSVALLLRHVPMFLMIALIGYSPILLAPRTQPADPTDLAQALSVLAQALLALIPLIVVSTFGEAVIVHAAFQDMRRRPVRLVESLNIVLRRSLAVVGFAFVATFLIQLGLVLLIVPGFILYTMWFVGLPACIIERLGPWTSLRRSRQLTKGHRWKLFGLALLIIIPGLGAGFLITTGLTAVVGPTVAVIVRLIWKAIWGAFATVVIVMTYHDLRVAKEGADIDQVAAVFD